MMAMVQGFCGLKTYSIKETLVSEMANCIVVSLRLNPITHHTTQTGLQHFGHKGNNIQ